MNSKFLNSAILTVFALVLIGAGHYATEVHQPRTLEQIQDKIKLAKLQRAQVEELLIEQAASAEAAEDVLRKWKARYKYIPNTLNTADVVLYLESLTRYGFEQFDVTLQGITNKGSHSYYTFKVNATAFLDPFYRFIWHIENNREFYRIESLSVSHKTLYKDNPNTEKLRRLDMVGASFMLHAYFAGSTGISTTEDEELMPLTEDLLPRKSPAHNSFYPIVRTDLPPNDELLLDAEAGTLVSIVGDRAIFSWDGRQYILGEGDRIYLGEIVKVDPMMSLVRVSLNKGGRIISFDIKMEMEDKYRQAEGEGIQVQPIDEF
ncbi:MAG: hypothetical protein KJO98_08900 [Rhodothermia bacterium]|nr:hypothetical protein [Rhodothermia bacterium]